MELHQRAEKEAQEILKQKQQDEKELKREAQVLNTFEQAKQIHYSNIVTLKHYKASAQCQNLLIKSKQQKALQSLNYQKSFAYYQ